MYSGISGTALMKLPTAFCTHASNPAVAVRSNLAAVACFHEDMSIESVGNGKGMGISAVRRSHHTQNIIY